MKNFSQNSVLWH